jgi:ribose 5-phosphate isomerase B
VTVRIAMGCDHAGYPLKEELRAFLGEEGHEVLDFGTDSTDPVDYPDFCAAAARAVVDGRADRGIVLGATGEGEAMVANKIRGVRAAVCNDLFTACLSRAHNDANVLAIGARVVAPALAKEILRLWLATPFDGGRHLRRIERISEIEQGET